MCITCTPRFLLLESGNCQAANFLFIELSTQNEQKPGAVNTFEDGMFFNTNVLQHQT